MGLGSTTAATYIYNPLVFVFQEQDDEGDDDDDDGDFDPKVSMNC